MGYKAGALENGLHQATGEFIAIFDADFVPQPDLLQKTIHYFSDPNIGMIQTRWGHLNEQYSLLTKIQSMLLDGHFLIEQTARARSGRFFNFNGTAGIWRRTCIQSSGGWQHDTLAEDLDLSYRAQIKGWQFLFLPEIVTPAELPIEMNAFKSQQHRWAKGSIQTSKKVLPMLWRSKLPFKIKFEGTVHLTSNYGYLLLLVLCLCFHSSAAAGTYQVSGGNPWTKMLLVDVPLFIAGSLSISAFYFCAQRELHTQWWKRLVYPADIDGRGHRPFGQQRAGRARSDVQSSQRVYSHPKYGVVTPRRIVGPQQIPDACADSVPYHRVGLRRLLHVSRRPGG